MSQILPPKMADDAFGSLIARLRYSSACSSLMSEWSFRMGFATDEPIIFCCGQWYRTASADAALRRPRRWFDLSDPGKHAAVARFPPRPAS
jgi:hypothetical protein